jgi:hypothetical protein
MNHVLRVCFLLLLSVGCVRGQDEWTKCDASEVIQCVSCILKCGVEVVGELIEGVSAIAAEQPEIDVADIKEFATTVQDCVSCASACSLPVAQFNKECPSTTHCSTDFCYTCCAPGANICVGNDFGQTCVTSQRQCICSSNSGNPNSCCSANGPGGGENTGNFCGNDFHTGACYASAPYCCTNDFNDPSCHTENGQC